MKSVQTYTVNFWSGKYYTGKKLTKKFNMYDGFVSSKSHETRFFHSPAELLQILEELYNTEEKVLGVRK